MVSALVNAFGEGEMTGSGVMETGRDCDDPPSACIECEALPPPGV